MLVCDYRTDLGRKFKLYRPFITGIDTNRNEFLEPSLILLTLSNYIDTQYYYEVSDKAKPCPLEGRPRRLVIEINPIIIEVEYPIPFIDIDWTIFSDLDVKAETVPEFINNNQVNNFLKNWT